MKVVVCVKQIPDTTAPGALDSTTHTLVRNGMTLVLDPGDESGIEAGLQIAEANGSEVVLVSMGPATAIDAIRKGLGMGAAKGILVTDDELHGADALMTAKVLAKAIEKEGFDLVITATESTDGYTGTLPQMLATLLHVPALTFAKEVALSDSTITIKRQSETGFEKVSAALPAIVSVTAGANEPRYPTLKGIMTAKSKPVETLSLGDLGLTNLHGEQAVTAQEAVAARGAGEVIADDGHAAERIADYLATVKVI